jgi:hypothetical protein
VSRRKKTGAWARALQAVASVFAAFGGFVVNIQPPEEAYLGYSIALAGVLSALLLLLLSAVGRSVANFVTYRRVCLILGAALIVGVGAAGVSYQNVVLVRTLDIPGANGSKPAKVIIGTELTPAARKWVQDNPCSLEMPFSCSNRSLFMHFGLDAKELVWTRESILESVRILNDLYLTFAVLLSSSTFVLCECLGESFLVDRDLGETHDDSTQTKSEVPADVDSINDSRRQERQATLRSG